MGKVEYLDRRDKTKHQKRKGLPVKPLLVLLLFIVAIFCVLLSPVFTIHTIEVTELECYTKSEICAKIGLSEGMNLFSFGKAKAKRVLEEDPYIQSASLQMQLPDTMVIDIVERKICGYVPYLGAYLYIDAEGRVLDSQTYFVDPHPLVKGLSFSSFQVGELLETDNADALEIVVQASRAIQKYELNELVLEMDISDPENLIINVGKIQVKLGNATDMDEKIRTLYEVVQNIPEGDRGTLDLSDLSKPIIFQYLT